MGFLHDLLLEERAAQHEKDLKEVYSMGFRDGRLCPAELRPCQVDGKPARFHRWVEEDKALLKVNYFAGPDEINARLAHFHRDGVIDTSCDIEKLHTFSALVEYEGGTVAKVNPELIRFTDRED